MLRVAGIVAALLVHGDRAGDLARKNWKYWERITIMQPSKQDPPYHDPTDCWRTGKDLSTWLFEQLGLWKGL